MATYFHGNPEMQANGDGLQTLILMNPAYVGYADNHHQLPPPPQASNFIFLNASSAINHSNPPPSQIHHLTGIPLQAATAASSPQYQDVSELHYNLHNPLIDNGAAREVKQGLSLSLSPQQPAPSQPLPGAAEVRVPNNVLLSCKYLKVAQELLDEVVFIGKNGSQSAKEDNGRPMITAELSTPAAGDGESGGGDGRDKRGGELSTAEKQEIQMKKAKLVNMLDEVEQRYKQYQHEMQMVISWFEQAAGEASAKTYTDLALQTISKQFRSLKVAILAQIRVATKSLGQQQMEGSSRLKYIDTRIRGLGMIHHNAWRPQRGLPERSVSVLRAWLFDHFLHPYPKDTDKIMLAKQTGLTRSQVSNWFINARVRLWKPMVEEMYTEELKGHQEQGSHDQIAGTTKHMKIPKLKDAAQTEIKNKSRLDNNTTSSTAADVENQHIAMNFFASYPMVGMEQFQPPYSGNGVSLTLGLQHCENLPISSANQDFMSTQTMHLRPANDFAPPPPTSAHDSIRVYDNIDVRTSKRFAAQLLPDFVT